MRFRADNFGMYKPAQVHEFSYAIQYHASLHSEMPERHSKSNAITCAFSELPQGELQWTAASFLFQLHAKNN